MFGQMVLIGLFAFLEDRLFVFCICIKPLQLLFSHFDDMGVCLNKFGEVSVVL